MSKQQSKNVEVIYPLSHMQHGILFHTLYTPESSVYFEQFRCTFHGDFQPTAFKAAWEEVVKRHQPLRTMFVWEKRKDPLQVVRLKVELPWQEMDWRGQEHEEAQFQAFLEEDRAKGFDLNQAPLMRCTLIRCDQDRYRFVWSHHHILLDGWSMTNIFKEVFAFYHGVVKGQPHHAPPVRPYRDYIQYLQKQDLSKAEAYWRETLAEYSVPSILSPEGAANPDEMGAYLNRRLLLNGEETTKLNDFAKSQRLTLNTLAHAAWSLLLHRYTGEKRIMFGSTVSGRQPDLQGVGDMVGLFINTLPVVASIDESEAVLPFLQAFQDHLQARDEFNYTALVDIQRFSPVEHGTPIFESLFVFQNHPVERSMEKGEQEITDIDLYEQTNYPLMVEVVPGEKLLLSFSYLERHFDAVAVDRLLATYKTMLLGLVGRATSLAEVNPVVGDQEDLLLKEYTHTDVAFPVDKTFAQLFEAIVAQYPDKLAATDGKQRLSYSQLNQRANALAKALNEKGTGPETVTGIFAERSCDFLIGILAVFKCGGAYLPFDINHPAQRIAQVAGLARPVQILADAAMKPALEEALATMSEETRPGVMDLHRDGLLAENPSHAGGPDHLAYVIYTSGSTGTPKGAMVHQAGMVNHLYGKVHDLKMSAEDILAQNAPQMFDISVWQFLSALLVGGQVHIFDEDSSRDPVALCKGTEAQELTILEVVPSMLRMMMDEIETAQAEAGREAPTFPTLQQLMLTGEALPPDIARRWLKVYPKVPIINAYGPTECSDDITHFFIHQAPSESMTNTPIGQALPNMRLYILDKHMRVQPLGAFGEAHAGGIAVGRGYLDDPRRTASVFVPDPFSSEPGARLYKTGDRVRWIDERAMEFRGRLDHQIKLRGFRIETGEIEATLKKHETVAEALVMVREDRPGDKQLVGYVTPAFPEEGKDALRVIPVHDVRAGLKGALPDYMVPAALVALNTFPLTPNGKIDRKKLPEPDYSAMRGDFVPARTRNELVICEIWQEALEIERVGIYDNFFDLGGHSIIATQMIARIRNQLQVELPLRELFANPEPAALAERITQLRLGGKNEVNPIVAVPRDKPLPLSFIQQSLWFLFQMEPNNSAYNITRPIRIHGYLEPGGIVAAFEGLVSRHEVLRSVFIDEDGVPYQIIKDDIGFRVVIEDFTHIPEDEREAVGLKVSDEEAKHIFSLQDGPLYKVRVIKFADDDHVLIINLHHIVSDIWSREIMVRDAGEFYMAHVEGREPELPPLDVQFGDYAVWQRSREHILSDEMDYWRKQLADLPTLDLPTDRPRPPVFRPYGETIYFEVDKETTDAFKTLASKQGVTPFMFMLAIFKILLSRYSSQQDIAVGSPVANRGHREVEELIGFFVNTQVLRTKLHGNPTFPELLERVREMMLAAYDHQETPFDRLVAELNPERDLSRNPLFQVVFLYEPGTYKDFGLSGMHFTYLYTERATNKFDLTFQLIENKDGNGLTGLMEFNKDVFEAKTFERMHRQFMHLVKAILANPRGRIDDYQLLPEDEKTQLLGVWNDTNKELDNQTPLHRHFEAQVAATPETTALVFEDRDLTYAELNARANMLARNLQAQGVSRGDLIPLCMERSLELEIALFGVLKAGAAYVPLDPNHPVDRLRFILDELAAPVALVQESTRDVLPEHRTPKLQVESQSMMDMNAAEAQNLEMDLCHLDGAYMIYTSGSTGKPKGVLVSHGSVNNRLQWQKKELPMGVGDRILQKTPYTFDVSVWELFQPLLNGATLVMAHPQGHMDPTYLSRTIAEQDISIIHFVPSMLHAFLDSNFEPADFLKLRQVLCSGEALSFDLQEAFFKALPNVALYNLYGPTEAAVEVTVYACKQGEGKYGLPIGKPIANTTAYTLDRKLSQTPIKVPGELCLGGVNLARGYYQRPALTAQQFIPDPFSKVPGARLYKTGDRARRLENGDIGFLGRMDYQVKLRGLRIELGEIESAMMELSAIDEVVVIIREDKPGDQRLVAYVVTENDQDPADVRGEWQEQLSRSLPKYMIPAIYIGMESLPRTGSGKVDRKRLPAPDTTQRDVDHTPPRNETEQAIADIWSKILEKADLSIHDDFFTVGGHSLLATRVISHVQDHFKVELSVMGLFQAPTIVGMAEAVAQAQAENRSSGPAIKRSSRRRKRLKGGKVVQA